MYQGFYDLASGMITQRRNLNTISNNMVNVQTAGYKKDTMVSTTFKEEMMIRTGKIWLLRPELSPRQEPIRIMNRARMNRQTASMIPHSAETDSMRFGRTKARCIPEAEISP